MALSMRRDGNTICLSLAIAIQVLERIPDEQRPRAYEAMRSLLREVTGQRNADLYRDSAAALGGDETAEGELGLCDTC